MNVLVLFPLLNANSPLPASTNLSNVEQEEVVFDKLNEPNLSLTGTHVWWDSNFKSRQLINISNPYSISFVNYGVNVSFNYSELVNEGEMNSSLKDVRIVEYDGDTHYLRKYYFKINYPETDMATVWFDINVSANSNEVDTYLYYGNDNVEIDMTYFINESSNSASDSFGWIRNGDFELDVKNNEKTFNFFGWNWSNDVPDDVDSGYVEGELSTEYQHNNTIDFGYQERVAMGDYSFKWGDKDHYIEDDSLPTGGGQDYIGTLYSYPFIVPTISGSGTPKISIRAYRNIRLYDRGQSQLIGFFSCISSSYSQDVSSHYVEAFNEDWESIGNNQGGQTSLINQKSPFNTIDTKGIEPYRTTDGGLTGYTTYDVTAYQGQLIFLEFGIWGSESSNIAAFGQVDDVSFNYTLQATLNTEVEEQRASITIIARDIDGRIVPNAEISIVNMSSQTPIIETRNSSSDGSATFTDIDYGTYNITVNYTLPMGNETDVYDSNVIGGRNFTISESQHNFTINLDMWTIDFEFVDSNKKPLNAGYVLIKESPSGGLLGNTSLINDGKVTFRWKNQSSYYYEIIYDNIDYNLNPTALNASYIYRNAYDIQKEKYNNNTIWVNKTNTASGNYFSVSERIYTNGSVSEIGNKKIIKANITLTGMTTNLDDVSVYYIDKDNSTAGNLIFFDDSYTLTDDNDFIQIDIRSPQISSDNLIADNYEVYGLYIVINGQNTSQCNGIVKIDLIETCNIYNETALSKINIRVIDSVGEKVIGCLVKVNGTNRDGFFQTDLITKELGDGYAYGQINNNLPLWYLKGYTYNFSLVFFGEHKNLIVNSTEPSQWKPVSNVVYYNYTLYEESNLTFEVYLGSGVNVSEYKTKFINLTFDEDVIWGENISVNVNFTLTTDNGITWEPLSDPDQITCTVRSTGPDSKTYLTLDMNPGIGAGIFTVTFNTSRLSAGNYGEIYSIIVSGSKTGYSDPSQVNNLTYIDVIQTVLSLHDYYDSFSVINEMSQVYGELINISIKYYNDSISPLEDAIISYEWLNQDPVQFYKDPVYQNYYTFTINTSDAGSLGTKSIKITAKKENYSTQLILFGLNIIVRSTTLNGKDGLLYYSKVIWVEDPQIFTFAYEDALTENATGDLNVATYIWQETTATGSIIAGSDGTGSLTENANKTYSLNFNTEIKPVGYYYLYVTLQKENYQIQFALINIEIRLREFNASVSATSLSINQINIVKGTPVIFKINLVDSSRASIPLTGASVILSVNNINYSLNESSPGEYTYTFETKDIDALFFSQTYTSKLIIQKDNFTKQEISLTLVIGMEEIFPGIPVFYFLLIVISSIAVVVSVIAYRVIQNAKIPGFVKKIRKVKDKIKGKKSISEDYSIPSRERMILKLIGDDWKEIGLSLEEVLGIESEISKGKIEKGRGETI